MITKLKYFLVELSIDVQAFYFGGVKKICARVTRHFSGGREEVGGAVGVVRGQGGGWGVVGGGEGGR